LLRKNYNRGRSIALFIIFVDDCRFYRRKYNAAKVLEGFAATARDETDLDRLTAELLRVIQGTMEPEFVKSRPPIRGDSYRPTTDNRPLTTDH
jgi:hypothetical protein